MEDPKREKVPSSCEETDLRAWRLRDGVSFGFVYEGCLSRMPATEVDMVSIVLTTANASYQRRRKQHLPKQLCRSRLQRQWRWTHDTE